MNRILVIGSPGSGKSTFALRLSGILQIPVIHLDNLNWQADKTTVENDEFLRRVKAALVGESWIMDGNYSATMAMRMDRSDTVIFLDYDLETCLESIKSRIGKVRVDIPWVEEELDQEFYEYVRAFPEKQRPSILELLAERKDQNIITLKNRDEGEAFLRALEEITHHD